MRLKLATVEPLNNIHFRPANFWCNFTIIQRWFSFRGKIALSCKVLYIGITPCIQRGQMYILCPLSGGSFIKRSSSVHGMLT